MSCPNPTPINSTIFGGHTFALEWVRLWIGKANQTETCKKSDLFLDMAWDKPILTYKGCLAFMGHNRWYDDPGSRVYVWVIPLLFLLFNVALGPADKSKLFAIVHVLGDPIDTIWSLLDKLHAWNACYAEAEALVGEKCGMQEPRGLETDDSEKRGPGNSEGDGMTAEGGGGQDMMQNQIGAVSVAVAAATVDAIGLVDDPNKDKSQFIASLKEAEPRGEQTLGDGSVPDESNQENSIRILATVFAGLEELVGHRPNCEEIYRETAEELNACDVTALQPGRDPNNFVNVEWRRAALNLTDHRTNEFVRTLLALSVYFLAIFAEFIDQISGNGEASPAGRIGAAMCLSWLIPATLLSNLLGNFPSRRTCLETGMRLVAETTKSEHPDKGQSTTQPLVPSLENEYLDSPVPSSWDEYFDSMPFTGSNYSFRPFKARNIQWAVGSERRTRLLLPLLALIPLGLAFIPAMIIHHYAVPKGISCRHLWILGLFAVWIISTLLTHLFQALADWKETPWWRVFFFWLTYAKDLAIGMSAITMIFLSVAGIFSNCWCWCRVPFLGEENGYMPLSHRDYYMHNKKSRFPALVAVFQGCQILYVVAIARRCQRGRKLALWGEPLKREVWWQIQGGADGGNDLKRPSTRFLLWGLRKQRKD